MLFAQAGVQYEDVRLSSEQWGEMKASEYNIHIDRSFIFAAIGASHFLELFLSLELDLYQSCYHCQEIRNTAMPIFA